MKGDLAIIEIHHRHGRLWRGETRANEIKDGERERERERENITQHKYALPIL